MTQISSINQSQRTLLLENGMVIQSIDDRWFIRRYEPNETMDSKWDFWMPEFIGLDGNGQEKVVEGGWCAAVGLCFWDIKEAGYKTAEEAINIALNTDWEEVERKVIERIGKNTARTLTPEEIDELVNSESWKKGHEELKQKIKIEQAPYVAVGYTHTGWASGAGADNIYLKETQEGWLSDRGILYDKETGLAVEVAKNWSLFQLDLDKIKKME